MPKRNHRHAPDKPEDQNRGEQQEQERQGADSAQEELIRLLTLEKEQLQDQLLRAVADLQNFKKRSMQEQAQLRQFATEQLVYDLLPVLDNLERSLEALSAGASPEAVQEGVQAVARQLRSVLETRSLRRIESLGAQFDPNLHEAIGSKPSEEYPEGAIAEEIEAGYRMGEKVIRPARVRVAAKP